MDGSYYEGEMCSGQKKGKGIELKAKNEYRGDFLDGLKSGHGEMKDADFNKYTGQWLNDEKHG